MRILSAFKEELKTKRPLFAVILLGLGGLGRLLLVDLPNIETVLVVSMLAGCMLGGIYTLLIPIMVMAITDFQILGSFHPIFLFTWAGFIFLGFIGYLLKGRRQASVGFIGILLGVGLAGTILYDFWTDVGWWYLMYPGHTLSNFSQVLMLQIPFTLRHLLSTAIFMPLVSVPLLYLYEHGWQATYSSIKGVLCQPSDA
jgi:hypothetical protein